MAVGKIEAGRERGRDRRDPASYLGRLRTEAPPMFALSWFLKSEDPDLSLHPNLFSKRAPLPNRAHYVNPDVDELLLQTRQAGDRAKHADRYRRVQRMVVGDAPWILVDHEIQVVAARAGLKGFKLHPSGFDLWVERLEQTGAGRA